MSRMDKSGIEKRIVGKITGSEEMVVDTDVIKGRVVRGEFEEGGGRYLCQYPQQPGITGQSNCIRPVRIRHLPLEKGQVQTRTLGGDASSTISGNPEAQHYWPHACLGTPIV